MGMEKKHLCQIIGHIPCTGGGINLLNKDITPERAAAIGATACLSL